VTGTIWNGSCAQSLRIVTVIKQSSYQLPFTMSMSKMNSYTMRIRVSKLLSRSKTGRRSTVKLPLEHSGEYHGSAVLYFPITIQRARDRAAVIQQEDEEEHCQKASA
jgi:hypothetical protein